MKTFSFLLFILLPAFGFCDITDSANSKKLEIGISFSPDYCFRKLKSEESSQWIANMRDTLEIPKIGFTAGLRLEYAINKKISVETGLLFTDKGQKTKNYSLDNPPIGKDPIKNTFVYHDYYLVVPLSCNYYILTGKLKLFATVGLSANIFLTQQTTSIAEYSYKAPEKTKSKSASDFSRFNVSILAGLGIKYKLGNKINFGVEPIYCRSLNSISNSPVKSYLYSIGVNIGFNYQL